MKHTFKLALLSLSLFSAQFSNGAQQPGRTFGQKVKEGARYGVYGLGLAGAAIYSNESAFYPSSPVTKAVSRAPFFALTGWGLVDGARTLFAYGRKPNYVTEMFPARTPEQVNATIATLGVIGFGCAVKSELNETLGYDRFSRLNLTEKISRIVNAKPVGALALVAFFNGVRLATNQTYKFLQGTDY